MYRDINLVVGAGFSGCVMARSIASQLNEKVLVIDKKSHIAGNSYDYINEDGICVHQYGSHIFHTNNYDIWKYVQKYSKFNTYMHKVYAIIDGIETTIPFNLKTLVDLFPQSLAKRLEIKLLKNFLYNTKVPILNFENKNDPDLDFLSNYIYEKVFKNYTKKQWGVNPDELDKDVTSRVPVLIGKDSRYFQDIYQGIPVNGYSGLIKNILDHKNIELKLNTNYSDLKSETFKRIFYTGSIDEFFDYQFGTLPYRSVKFSFEKYNKEYYQNNSVINYPNNYDFTRIHEYKYYLNDKSPNTIIAKEYSEPFKIGENDRFYPIPNQENHQLYLKYLKLSEKFNNVYFLGRLGDYKYYDMDRAILRSLSLFNQLFPVESKIIV